MSNCQGLAAEDATHKIPLNKNGSSIQYRSIYEYKITKFMMNPLIDGVVMNVVYKWIDD